jgi:NAD(P)-dependent dehydrogenase (short-subunit alcohol dehydrogenase family)
MAYAVTNRGHFGRRRRARHDQEHQPRPQAAASPPAGPFSDCPVGKLTGKVALVAGGDSGIGRAVAIAFAKEGADIAIVYLNEHRGAEETRRAILRENVRCILVAEDTASEARCHRVIKRTIAAFGRLDILVNNAAEQQPQPDLMRVAREQREQTLRTNLLGMFYLTKAAMPHLPAGGAIINTTAVTAWRDSAYLVDDDATTATIVSFTRSLADSLIDRGIRANAATPSAAGAAPIRAGFRSGSRWEWAPALDEIAPGYVSLAEQDGSFITGQVLRVRAA